MTLANYNLRYTWKEFKKKRLTDLLSARNGVRIFISVMSLYEYEYESIAENLLSLEHGTDSYYIILLIRREQSSGTVFLKFKTKRKANASH